MGTPSPRNAFPRPETRRASPTSSLDDYLALRQVPWSMAYIGFLLYFIVITTYIADWASAAMVIALLGLALERTRVQWPLPIRLLLMFWIWAAISRALSPYPGDFNELLDLGKVMLVFLVSVNVLKHPRRLQIFLLLYVTIFAIYPIRGTLFNYFLYDNADFGRPGWRGSFGNTNDMAALTILGLAIAASFLRKGVPYLVRVGALLAACFVFPLVILLTQSRAAFIGLTVFVLLIVLSIKRNRLPAVLALAAAAAVVIAVAPDAVWERVARLQYAANTEDLGRVDPEGSAKQRWEIWQTGLHIIADRPFTGVGIGQYEQANRDYSPSLGLRDVHDTYLEVLAETGAPGLLLFLWLLMATILRARRSLRNAKAMRDTEAWGRLRLLEIGLYAYMAAGIWGTFGFLSLLYIYLAIIYSQSQALDASLAEMLSRTEPLVTIGPESWTEPQNTARSA